MIFVAGTSFLDPENLGLDPLLAPLSCEITILEQFFSFGIMAATNKRKDQKNLFNWLSKLVLQHSNTFSNPKMDYEVPAIRFFNIKKGSRSFIGGHF